MFHGDFPFMMFNFKCWLESLCTDPGHRHPSPSLQPISFMWSFVLVSLSIKTTQELWWSQSPRFVSTSARIRHHPFLPMNLKLEWNAARTGKRVPACLQTIHTEAACWFKHWPLGAVSDTARRGKFAHGAVCFFLQLPSPWHVHRSSTVWVYLKNEEFGFCHRRQMTAYFCFPNLNSGWFFVSYKYIV